MLSLHRLTSCAVLCSSSLPLYSGHLLLSLGILLTYIDTAWTWTYRKHITWSLSSHSIGTLAGPEENTYHVISKYCCVTSLRRRKLHRHKENAAAVLLTVCVCVCVCVLRALSGNGFTCHNIKVHPKEIWCEVVHWVPVSHIMGQWLALVHTEMNLWVA
jgi:hypothetical protein